MADTSHGMSPDPFGCTGLRSRLMCRRCHCEPEIKNPEKVVNGPMLTITAVCHGEEETRMIEKKELVFTQYFFKPEQEQ